jgi:hypothetical protein
VFGAFYGKAASANIFARIAAGLEDPGAAEPLR